MKLLPEAYLCVDAGLDQSRTVYVTVNVSVSLSFRVSQNSLLLLGDKSKSSPWLSSRGFHRHMRNLCQRKELSTNLQRSKAQGRTLRKARVELGGLGPKRLIL